MGLKEKFANLDSKQKKKVIWVGIGACVLLATVVGYNSRSRRVQDIKNAADQEKVIRMNPDMIQKTMLRESRREMDEMRKKLNTIEQVLAKKDSVTESNKKFPQIPGPDKVTGKKTGKGTAPPPPGEKKEERWPKPLNAKNGKNGNGRVPSPPGGGKQQQPQMIGEIAVLSNPDAATDQGADHGETGKKKRTVYLPPSFMEAQLLTGFDASTSGKGKNNPEPLLLRIQTPAVLPNDIKAELQGCFIVAEAVGRLDKERADVRLVSLSCLSNQGKAVIDTPIKGFVTDSDSKVGLSGRVVSRMGATAARAVVAGFFGGMGDALRASSTTQTTSALGSTSIVDSSQLAKYSLGGGLSEGADSLKDFYLTLARQSTPVIEVGAAKKITVVISEGKELEIREINDNETL